MPAISLAGVDSAGGGLIISSSGVQSTLDGAVIAVHGDRRLHRMAMPPNVHIGATLVASHFSSTIAGHRIVTAGDMATCGHCQSLARQVQRSTKLRTWLQENMLCYSAKADIK